MTRPQHSTCVKKSRWLVEATKHEQNTPGAIQKEARRAQGTWKPGSLWSACQDAIRTSVACTCSALLRSTPLTTGVVTIARCCTRLKARKFIGSAFGVTLTTRVMVGTRSRDQRIARGTSSNRERPTFLTVIDSFDMLDLFFGSARYSTPFQLRLSGVTIVLFTL